MIVRCKTCHYSLTNLTKHRCPECGKPFDPNDPSSFDTRNHNLPDWLLMMLSAAFLGAAVGLCLLIYTLFEAWRGMAC